MTTYHSFMRFCVLLAGLTLFASTVDAQITGWRGDGSGRFEKAQPPTEWSKDSDNILWKMEAGRGYSSPVLSEGRLFITAQPSQVICVNAADGKELWRQTANYAAALGEAEAPRIANKHEELNEARRAANDQYNTLRKSDPDSPKLEALNKQRKEADNRRKEFERQFPPEKRGGAGNEAATIVCDGERVFALFGAGVVAAFSVEGKLLWAKHLEAPQQGFGHSASPIIAGGKLIVHIRQLLALDPETGKTAWTAEVPAKFGTPAVAKVSGEDVIVTPSGAMVVAADGRILAQKQFQLSNNSPLVHDGVIYAHEGGKVKAFRLPDSLQTPFEPELLWETSGARDQRMASALYHDGLLYAAGRRGILDVTDAETGKSVYKKRSNIGDIFSSPTMAGGLIFYAGKNGETLVLRPGKKYEEVAINKFERVSTIPLFAGRRMYLRTDKSLYCIGE